MFSPALGRAARSTVSIPPPSACTLGRPAAVLGAVQQAFPRPPHQRRLSSSKASMPPDGSNGPNSAQPTSESSASKAPARKPTGRTGRKKSAAQPALNVPHVPPTDYLQKPEVKIASFFSLHRPISVTSAIPPMSTTAVFDSIFQGRAPGNRKVITENIQTLAGSIESLEAALRANEQKQTQEESVQAEADTYHLDSPPQASIDELMSRLIPFRPPPVPEPLESGGAVRPLPTPKTEGATTFATPAKQRSWSTKLVLTESTDAEGNRTYTTTTAPMVPMEEIQESAQETEDVAIHQPFLERMRQRQNTYDLYLQGRPDMLAISVKRQRKLKMKKHKYKKLMKRTRLLRKKLDRL
ncbi:hypothetical protein P154DRAFT_530543 [Amniculicola lignicola CBS 123094]|uniref:Small ribosomal subunit protein mS38 n=1 Tax=Amniculicola lignicola CBS 123094 TaxID=1392246 RepID=A0A6A5WV94_9PLEO|nr:hypothetical protein P154DRAFT_530543 [Amniculicola lignicola CBS 123094]